MKTIFPRVGAGCIENHVASPITKKLDKPHGPRSRAIVFGNKYGYKFRLAEIFSILKWFWDGKWLTAVESLHETRELACSWIRVFSARSSVSNKIWNFLLVNFFRFKIILRWKVTESSRITSRNPPTYVCLSFLSFRHPPSLGIPSASLYFHDIRPC